MSLDDLRRAIRDELAAGDPLRPTGHDDECPSRSGGSCPRDAHGVPECRR